ncbi:MAG: hypothetical protein U5N56_03030 [Candidatus Marinimicrobia bacterium]|nr:hypothetical protein [Candidatus Neomarinimicrobiota bacterium]
MHAGLDLSAYTERRSFPVRDSFGDFLAENDYVSNRFQKWGGDMALYYSQQGFSASAGWYTLENLKYEYREEIRSDLGTGTYNRDPLAGLHLVSFSGILHGFRYLPLLMISANVLHWDIPTPVYSAAAWKRASV